MKPSPSPLTPPALPLVMADLALGKNSVHLDRYEHLLQIFNDNYHLNSPVTYEMLIELGGYKRPLTENFLLSLPVQYRPPRNTRKKRAGPVSPAPNTSPIKTMESQ